MCRQFHERISFNICDSQRSLSRFLRLQCCGFFNFLTWNSDDAKSQNPREFHIVRTKWEKWLKAYFFLFETLQSLFTYVNNKYSFSRIKLNHASIFIVLSRRVRRYSIQRYFLSCVFFSVDAFVPAFSRLWKFFDKSAFTFQNKIAAVRLFTGDENEVVIFHAHGMIDSLINFYGRLIPEILKWDCCSDEWKVKSHVAVRGRRV